MRRGAEGGEKEPKSKNQGTTLGKPTKVSRAGGETIPRRSIPLTGMITASKKEGAVKGTGRTQMAKIPNETLPRGGRKEHMSTGLRSKVPSAFSSRTTKATEKEEHSGCNQPTNHY